MNAELKAKWAAALRSGQFSQVRGTLRNDHGYCCLGVLCMVAGREVQEDKLNQQASYDFLAALHRPRLTIEDPEWYRPFIHMNDLNGFSFTEIAAEVDKL